MSQDISGFIVSAVKWLASVILSMIVILGAAAWAGDTRWVTNEKLEKSMTKSALVSEKAANALRKQLLEDKIFELDQIPDRDKSNVQRAVANRTRSQLQEVTSKEKWLDSK